MELTCIKVRPSITGADVTLRVVCRLSYIYKPVLILIEPCRDLVNLLLSMFMFLRIPGIMQPVIHDL